MLRPRKAMTWILPVLIAAGTGGAAALALPRLMEDDGVGAGGSTREAVSSSGAQVSPSQEVESGFFAGFWPATTHAEARAVQAKVDAGEDGWMTDPAAVAGKFLADFAGWGGRVRLEGQDAQSRVDSVETSIGGSAAQGWTALVKFRHRLIHNETSAAHPGTLHTMALIGLRGAERPAWFVTSLESDLISVDSPGQGQAVASPFTLTGRGSGFEATINYEIRDDRGEVLGTGYVMGGSTEPQPFSGSAVFETPFANGGILLLTPSQGAEGPPSDMTIVRMQLEGSSK